MNRDEIEKILQQICESDSESYDTPSAQDWASLENNLKIQYSEEYKLFISLLGKYEIPLMVLNIIDSDNSTGDDTVKVAYDYEQQNNSLWPSTLIPFIDIGNGDYFCFSCDDLAVHYYYHDKQKTEKYADNFSDWLKQLPEFLDV
ncbi:SMI1/KNR4 family protein [Sessilibacter corallicola]|uniref:SMI1/KNR4 family protein n=1 Tax=Sessilibacter corallicola TaxID=2904075 RepID=UPI001E33B0BE|nr:SMI1/KNR4 family protein [Sessilibacter corallicola]MCE2029736.1 SMI1/KNR4 family protein [Sessilibacter corallicola]